MTNVHTDSSGQGFVLGNKALVEEVFAKNGFLVLSSDTGGEKTSEVKADSAPTICAELILWTDRVLP